MVAFEFSPKLKSSNQKKNFAMHKDSSVTANNYIVHLKIQLIQKTVR